MEEIVVRKHPKESFESGACFNDGSAEIELLHLDYIIFALLALALKRVPFASGQ